MNEFLRRANLPELSKFNEVKIKPDESLDLSLATIRDPIKCFTSAMNAPIAKMYGAIIGKNNHDFEIIPSDDPIKEAMGVNDSSTIPLVIHSATDPDLNRKMFIDGPGFGQLLLGHIYAPRLNLPPSLYAIGVANQGLEIIGRSQIQPDEDLAQKMEAKRRETLNKNTLANDDFKKILRSPHVKRIIAHALGPTGTNIAQAMGQYVNSLGVENKTDLIVHPTGVVPLDYAEKALEQIEEGIVPIHMECSVYYDMARLFEQRQGETVFADHHFMPLDAMRLASIKDIEELASSGIMRIAAHASPMPLIIPWIEAGKASWKDATSNSAAAQMVIDGQADACITTASSLKDKDKLETRHVFGSPIMLFNVGTPLNQKQLNSYLSKL